MGLEQKLLVMSCRITKSGLYKSEVTMTKFIVVTWSYNYHNSKNIKQLMEQIFPLSFELVNDGQQLNITAFDTQARIRNIEIAPVPAVAIVNYINSSAKDNHSTGIIRKCYPPALIFDLYPINNKTLYRVVSESGAYDLSCFAFNCRNITVNYEHLPAVAVLLQHWDINPCGWLDYLPSAAPRQINNSLLPPAVNLSQLAASVNLHDFDRRLKMANLWYCPVNVVDTKNQIYYFLTKYNPSLLAKALPANLVAEITDAGTSITLTPASATRVTTNKAAKRFPDTYVAEMFGIQNVLNKLTTDVSNPCYFKLYRLIDMGYYNTSKLDVNRLIDHTCAISGGNNELVESNGIYIRKTELLLPPPHLKSLVTKVRQSNLLAYCDIVVK